MTLKREFYRDTWNENKVWEVVYMRGGMYLRQYISGRQWNKGMRTTKAFIKSIGIFDMQRIESV